jgi:hypothetical protein
MFRKSFGVAAIVLATLLALPSLAQDASKKQKSTAASRCGVSIGYSHPGLLG